MVEVGSVVGQFVSSQMRHRDIAEQPDRQGTIVGCGTYGRGPGIGWLAPSRRAHR